MRSVLLTVSALLVACSCVVAKTRTGVVVARYEEGRKYRACSVELSSSAGFILADCGDPDAVLKRSDGPGYCLVYRTLAGGPGDPSHAVVCLSEPEYGKGATTITKQPIDGVDLTPYRVIGAWSLRKGPG